MIRLPSKKILYACINILAPTVVLSLPSMSLSAQEQNQDDEDGEMIEELVITGSRFVRPNLSQPTPITTLSADDILMSGTTDLGKQLAELPALGSTRTLSGSSNSFSDLAGLNLADLRRLGTVRTLTLVDGKRHVGGSPGTTSVDLNSIPTSLVERVEIITGGASAVYGSDAVSGVINIITKTDFEGFNFDVESGRAANGDYAENYQAGFTWGTNFNNDRGNVTFSARLSQIGDIQANDLPFTDDYGSVVNPMDTGEDDGIPDRFLVANVVSEFIDENGVILLNGAPNSFSNSNGLIAFDDNGNPLPQAERDLSNSFAFGRPVGGCLYCFEIDDYVTVVPEIEQKTFNSTFNYELTDNISAYVQAKYITSDIVENLQPSFDFFNTVIDVAENPFLNESLRTELLAAGGTEDFVLLNRFHNDRGGRINEIERETIRIVGGLKGMFETNAANLDWDFYYNYGTVENKVHGLNRQLPDNFDQAVDSIRDPVTNEIRCRDTSLGVLGRPCVPFNPFGQQNSAEAVAFSFVNTDEKQKLKQANAGFTVITDSSKLFELPSGPIDFATGVEWRKETSSTDGDPVVQADFTDSAAQPDEVGGFEVGEAFVEFSVPILSNVFLVDDLTFDAAYRVADYTHTGRARANKYALTWSLIPQFALRGTYSEAVRAPAITEAFRPTTPGFADVDDPCDVDSINDDPDRPANCLALGIPPNFDAMDNASVDAESSGNRNLKPEDSTSFTYGFILQPDWFAPGLSLTVDLYDIEIEDAITLVLAQSIVDNCVDATGGPDPLFCNLFTRDSTNNIDFVRSTFINASKFETEGIDVQVNYDTDLDFNADWLDGSLRFNLTGNYLRELNFFEFQDRPDEVNIERGEVGDPIRAFRSSLSYAMSAVTVGWEVRYVGNQKRIAVGVDNDEDLSPSDTGSSTYQDLTFRLFMPTESVDFELYGGVNNFTDEEPPLGLTGVEDNEAIFDAVGRYYFLGVRGNF